MVFAVFGCGVRAASFTVRYEASEGGRVAGRTEQTVDYGGDAEPVTAIARNGYVFSGWSDGVVENTRNDKNIKSEINVTALFEKKRYTLAYEADEHGYIDGQTEQSVKYRENGTTVTAVANDGYEFVNWSDGVTTAERTETDVTENKSLTAYFTEYTRKFKINYKFGQVKEGNGISEATLGYSGCVGFALPVPEREHFTFGGWYVDGKQIAGNDGKIKTDECLTSKSQEIYAEWTANETFTYKILLVYVTEINATLQAKDGMYRQINYKMSDLEREFYELTTQYLKRVMDGMLDGLVDFQVDEYYTTELVITEYFDKDRGANILFPDGIPEVKDIITEYDSVLTVDNLNDYKEKLRYWRGIAQRKNGEICADPFFYQVHMYCATLEEVIESFANGGYVDTKSGYGIFNFLEVWFDTIVHELAHTIERRMGLYEYHSMLGDALFDKHLSKFEAQKLYYLNEAVIDGEKVGIPYEFWKGDIATLTYNPIVVDGDNVGFTTPCDHGGSHFYDDDADIYNLLAEPCYYEVTYGRYITSRARIDLGGDNYEFVCWSDGVTTPERTDCITGDREFTAIFRKIDDTV